MSRMYIAPFLSIALICLSPFVLGKAVFAQTNSALQGITTLDAAGTRSPVSGVLLTLMSPDRAFQTRSTRDGTFRFDDVPGGTYEISVSAENYVRQQFPVQLSSAAVRSLDISLKLTSQPDMNHCGPHPSFSYSSLTGKTSRVAGMVTMYPNQRTLKGANLTLSSPSHSEPEFRAVSDQQGRFTFDGVPAGRYDLKVYRIGYVATEPMRLLVPRENNVEANIQIQKDDKSLVICQ